MKKIIAALLCAILALSLCACGAKPVPTETDTTEPDAVTDVDTGDEEEAENLTETGIEVDCGDFTLFVPGSWKDRFVSETADGITNFWFADAYEPSEAVSGGDGWLFSLSYSEKPDPDEQPGYGGPWEMFEIAKLTRGDEEKYIMAQRSERSLFAEEDRAEAGAMLDYVEKLGAGVKAKEGSVTEPLDYSDLDGTAWFARTDYGAEYKLSVWSITANMISAGITFFVEENGAWKNADAYIRMFGDWGYLTWNDAYAEGNSAKFGDGSLTLNEDGSITLRMTGEGDSWYNIEEGVTLENVYVPRGDEIGYISGSIKESCDYFEISLPDCWKGLYTCEKSADSLRFYHTASKAEWGGFIFSVTLRDPEPDEGIYDFITPFRMLVKDGEMKHVCISFPSDMQVTPQWMDQYSAMNKGVDAALATLAPTDPGARLEKFDLGFTSERYSGTNGNGDGFELNITRETIYTVDAELIFSPVSGEKSAKISMYFHFDEGQQGVSYSDYTDGNSEYTFGNGNFEFNGDDILLTLSNSEGDLPVDQGGVITLTPENV